jgi:hypothetical protein
MEIRVYRGLDDSVVVVPGYLYAVVQLYGTCRCHSFGSRGETDAGLYIPLQAVRSAAVPRPLIRQVC